MTIYEFTRYYYMTLYESNIKGQKTLNFKSGFLDSLVYVMLPSLFSFFALFWAFYALHSYTADQKNMAKMWSRVDRTRQSIRSGFNKSG